MYRVAELELSRSRERSEHDKLERLEECAEHLVKGLQSEHDKVCISSQACMHSTFFLLTVCGC